MSRSNGNKQNASAAFAKRLAPSHPIEQSEEHRAFLIRSLERNDKEIAALVHLTRSLRSVKQDIVQHCGHVILLDLGSGKIRLAPNGDGLVVLDDDDYDLANETTRSSKLPSPLLLLDERARELCVDFLLRLKLRRKLLSRLFRRVNRVAHAMDGMDVQPPAPPRYGDLRIHIEPSEVEAYHERWKRQEAARRMMEQLGDNESLQAASEEIKGNTLKGPDENGDTEMKELGNVGHSETPTLEQDSSKKRDIDYGALMSFNDGYEKMINPETGEFKYTILDDPYEEDYLKIKSGSGIGAVQRGMTAKEKETEFNRWQTAILNRIPEQPTYADLGLEHRVFLQEERRKRALEADKMSHSKKRTFADDDDERPEKGRGGKSLRKLQEEKDAKEGKGKHANDNTDPEKLEDVEVADNDGEIDTEKPTEMEIIGDVAPDDVQDADDSQVGQADEEKKQVDEVADNTEAAVKRTNPISLCPVPSFYDQDLKRIRLIHADLITTSMQSHSRQKLEDVVREYNKGKVISRCMAMSQLALHTNITLISFSASGIARDWAASSASRLTATEDNF
jgi:hypothetical protein